MPKTEIHIHEYVTVPMDMINQVYSLLHNLQVHLLEHECQYPTMNSDMCGACALRGEIHNLSFKLHEWTDK